MYNTTYQQQREVLMEEKRKYDKQLRDERDMAIEKYKEEFETKICQVNEAYEKHKCHVTQLFDERYSVLSKGFQLHEGKQDMIRIFDLNIFVPPKYIRDQTGYSATYYGTRCPVSSKICCEMTFAKKHLLHSMIKYIVDCILVRETEIRNLFRYTRAVMITFQQARNDCTVRKMVYVDAQERYTVVYYNYIFQSMFFREIMTGMLRKKLNMNVEVYNECCVLCPL